MDGQLGKRRSKAPARQLQDNYLTPRWRKAREDSTRRQPDSTRIQPNSANQMRQTGEEIPRCRSAVAVEQRHSGREQSIEPGTSLIDNNRQLKKLKRQEIQEFQDSQIFCYSEKYLLFLPVSQTNTVIMFSSSIIVIIVINVLIVIILMSIKYNFQ